MIPPASHTVIRSSTVTGYIENATAAWPEHRFLQAADVQSIGRCEAPRSVAEDHGVPAAVQEHRHVPVAHGCRRTVDQLEPFAQIPQQRLRGLRAEIADDAV